jgi:hypothetical protein
MPTAQGQDKDYSPFYIQYIISHLQKYLCVFVQNKQNSTECCKIWKYIIIF